MELRKTPNHDVYRRKRLHFQIGMTVTLGIIITAFEWKSEVGDQIIVPPFDRGYDLVDYIPPTSIETKKPPKPKVIAPLKKTLKFEETSDDLQEITTNMVDAEPTAAHMPEAFMPPPSDEPVEIVVYPETWPAPEDGFHAFYAFLGKNIRYPAKARKVGLEGKVYVQFLVNESGYITEAKIVKGIGMGCDAEVLRVMQLDDLPRWLPGRSGGRKVRVRMIIPVVFSLN